MKSGSKNVYALPMDSGPMALFYNKKVFDKYKVKVPTTWDEYLTAARTLHKADPKAYIANDTGDAGETTSLLWQAGSRPYKVDGTNVKIDFSDSRRPEVHRRLAEAPRREASRAHHGLERRLVQGAGRRHHRDPGHRSLDARQLRHGRAGCLRRLARRTAARVDRR